MLLKWYIVKMVCC